MIPQVLSQLRTGRDKLFSMLDESFPTVDVLDAELPETVVKAILDARTQIEGANAILQDVPIQAVDEAQADGASDESEY